MSYTKSEMLYDDGKHYKWAAKADHDNPFYTKGTDHSELNRTEGYEVLYFINHLAQKHWPNPTLAIYHKIERMIRHVPATDRTHKKVADWIMANWSAN
ncbi:hypothetical protein ACTHGU_01440 [Chitinophagaceae bacterium MMS25-I14]